MGLDYNLVRSLYLYLDFCDDHLTVSQITERQGTAMYYLQPTIFSSSLTSFPNSFVSTLTSTFSLIFASLLFSSILAADESDIVAVEMRELSPSDYQLGPSFTKEFSLLGKDNKAEKLRVMQRPSLFNKHFKVSKCGESGCKDEPLATEEEERATRCSYSGQLASDPESTVYISGCPEEKESMDISLMSKKSNFSSTLTEWTIQAKSKLTKILHFLT